jgi:hypothetical protein
VALIAGDSSGIMPEAHGVHESLEQDPVSMDAPAMESPPNAQSTRPPDAYFTGTSSNDRIQLLWQWKCGLTEGRNVSCMAWNHDRHDLAAVGYGSFVFGQQQEGLVCIWSMKNPSYPLWWFAVSSGVTSVDFSKATGAPLEDVAETLWLNFVSMTKYLDAPFASTLNNPHNCPLA